VVFFSVINENAGEQDFILLDLIRINVGGDVGGELRYESLILAGDIYTYKFKIHNSPLYPPAPYVILKSSFHGSAFASKKGETSLFNGGYRYHMHSLLFSFYFLLLVQCGSRNAVKHKTSKKY
jgi:hypothetical protein